MRYLIDTNIMVYLAIDPELLSRDVQAIMMDYDNQMYISAESVRELIIAIRNKNLFSKRWKTAEDMVESIENEYNVTILPITKEQMVTYAKLEFNLNQGHHDPSDHLIISHAITNKMPLISSDTLFPFYRKQGLELIFNDKTEGKGHLRKTK